MRSDSSAPPDGQIADAIFEAAARHADRTAMAEYRDGTWQTLAFAELAEAVRRLASGLAKLGVAPGDRVALVGANAPAWSVSYFAILRAGGVVVPLDRLQTPAEWTETLRRSGASTVLGAPHELEALKRFEAAGPVVRQFIRFSGDVRGDDLSLAEVQKLGDGYAGPFPQRAADDLAVIIFTSGTTGQSKGVMLSHRNILSDAFAILSVVRLSVDDRFLSVLPLSHAYESTCGLVAPLLAGASVWYARSLTPSEIVGDLRTSGATYLLSVPLLVEKIVAGIERALRKAQTPRARFAAAAWRAARALPQPWRRATGRALLGGLRRQAGLDRLRYLICGGAPLAPELGRAVEGLGVGFLQGYGLTETSPVATLNPPGDADPCSAGKPLPGVEVVIAAPDEEGSGEIRIRGPIVMRGYWQDPGATAEAIEDGWLLTGDRGRFDRRGRLQITGRSKLLIVTAGGKNIAPEEIELALLRSPFIAECLVYGAVTRHGGGEEVAAKIHLHEEHLAEWKEAHGEPTDLHALVRREIDRATANLAHYKHVVRFEITGEPFAKTTSQKIKRHLHIETESDG